MVPFLKAVIANWKLTVLAVIPAALLIGSVLEPIRNAFDFFADPLYTLGGLVLFVVTAGWALGVVSQEGHWKESQLVLPSAENPQSKVWVPKWRRSYFVAGGFLLLAFALAIAWYYSSYIVPFALADVSHVEWESDETRAITAENEVFPLALILERPGDPERPNPPAMACVRWDVTMRQRLTELYIDEIAVEVVKYRPLPKYRHDPFLVGAGQGITAYYVEIDDPGDGERKFVTRYSVEKGKSGLLEFAHEKIEARGREAIVLFISARTPGIYTIRCSMTVSNGGSQETIRIGGERTFLFDEEKSEAPFPVD